MIVNCTGCQARFRVADEKIGPRGAKVRCSRCQTVFVVKREAAAEPPPAPPRIELDLTPGLARPPRATEPGMAGPVPPTPPDPFAGAGLDALGELASGAADPFARAAAAAPAGEVELRSLGEPVAAQFGAVPSGDPFAQAAVARPPPLQQGAGAFPTDLALEDRGTPGFHAPFADPADVVAPADPSMAFGGAAFEVGASSPMLGVEPLAFGTEPAPAPSEPERPPPTPAPAAAKPTPPRAAWVGPEVDDLRQAGLARPASSAPGLRSVAVNALALVALLAIAAAFRLVLSGEALEPAALRPSRLLRALGPAPAQPGPFEVGGVRASVYEQTSGGSVLYVRGEVRSRSHEPLRAIRVQAELVRDGHVVTRGEARAGAVPSPEELDRATDQGRLEALGASVRKRAPAKVSPGDKLEFLVTLGDAPADLSGATVQVRAEADAAR